MDATPLLVPEVPQVHASDEMEVTIYQLPTCSAYNTFYGAARP